MHVADYYDGTKRERDNTSENHCITGLAPVCILAVQITQTLLLFVYSLSYDDRVQLARRAEVMMGQYMSI